jgi:hypothetical protein
MAKTAKTEASGSTKLTFDPKAWPIGTMVKYTGTRVAEHVGQAGQIVGYRPASGLWIKFPSGRGSISVKQAEIVSGKPGKAARQLATRKAPSKTAKPAKPAKAEPIQVQPATT